MRMSAVVLVLDAFFIAFLRYDDLVGILASVNHTINLPSLNAVNVFEMH